MLHLVAKNEQSAQTLSYPCKMDVGIIIIIIIIVIIIIIIIN